MEFNNVIKNVSDRQNEIINNIINMHNDGNTFDADITYSTGGFYKKVRKEDVEIEEPRLKFDVFPQVDGVEKIDAWGKIPVEDGTVKSVMFDPPFICAPRDSKSIIEPKDGSNIMFKRFASYYPMYELHESYSHWISEAYRILSDGGLFVVKCQNTISGSKFYANEEYVWMEAEKAGFTTIDKFNLIAKSRLISGKVKNQQHARNFNSVFWVFRKSDKKKIDYYQWLNDEKAIERMKSIKEASI